MEKLFNKFFGNNKAKKEDSRNIEKIITNSHDTEEAIKIRNNSNINLESKEKVPMQDNSEIVIVNSNDKIVKKTEGFYYSKYIDKIQDLKLSNPILVEREKMKVNFDSEVVDYLVNDLSQIFKTKQEQIDSNQVSIKLY
jgi:hypothetical protein